jgi:phage terminase small subunit
MAKRREKPAPPRHLSKKMREVWEKVFAQKNLSERDTLIFQQALETHDAREKCRRITKKHGRTYVDRWGAPKPRPEVQMEIAYGQHFAKLISMVNLDELEPWT